MHWYLRLGTHARATDVEMAIFYEIVNYKVDAMVDSVTVRV